MNNCLRRPFHFADHYCSFFVFVRESLQNWKKEKRFKIRFSFCSFCFLFVLCFFLFHISIFIFWDTTKVELNPSSSFLMMHILCIYSIILLISPNKILSLIIYFISWADSNQSFNLFISVWFSFKLRKTLIW